MRKIIGNLFFIQMLLILAILPISTLAGNTENPEIVDEPNDTDLPHLDILSAWFYEKNDEPEYLYTVLKVQSLNLNQNAVFSIRWRYDTTEYVTGFNTFRFKEDVFRSGDPKKATYWQWNNMPECEGITDQTMNTITWKVLKSFIGNPEKGDVLTQTKATAVPGFPISFLYFFLGRDFRDFAPDAQYGSDYIIQY